MSTFSTHVLDLEVGRPAKGVPVLLEAHDGKRGWTEVARGTTDDDGRVKDLLAEGASLDKGRYRLTFETGAYFEQSGAASFYPRIPVEFEIANPKQHYHVPLLLSPFGYSTYRGS